MKKNINIFLVGIMLTALQYSATAQLTEQKRTMSLGTQNALIFSIPDADDKYIIKMWKDYIKEYGKTKKNRKSGEYFSDDIKIPAISGGTTIDVYATSEDGQIITFFDMGDSFLSKESDKGAYDAAEIFLQEFAHEVKRDQIREEIKEEEKNLKRLGSDLSGLQKDKDGYHRDIEKAKEKIAQAESNIEQNIIDQENKEKEIEAQKELVEKIKRKLEKVGK